jgi:hypothetical protein
MEKNAANRKDEQPMLVWIIFLLLLISTLIYWGGKPST